MNTIMHSGVAAVPRHIDMTYCGWLADLQRMAPAIPGPVRRGLAMLLADKRFGREQMFLTADALCEAALEAHAAGDTDTRQQLVRLADLLHDQAATRRTPHATWHRAN